MKKLLLIVATAVVAVSCCSRPTGMHFDTSTGRAYYDETVEMDTLSYSMAMNVALGIRFQPMGNDIDADLLVGAMLEEVQKEVVDVDFLQANREILNQFSEERLRPHIMAKRMAMFGQQTTDLPELFDEKFTKEDISRYYGYDIADYFRRMGMPINMYWVAKSFNEALAIEGDAIDDSQLAISQTDMRRCVNDYFTTELKDYMLAKSRTWLNDVATQRDVHMMVVEGDTLYYRVDVAGNGVRPRTERDTIGFSYDVYTQRGMLVESHEKRVAALREALDKELADTTAAKAQTKEMRVGRLEKQLADIENLEVVLDRAIIKGSQYGVKNIGEGGQITLWLPASLAYGEKGNRAVAPNEGVVMTIKLKSVKYGKSDEELAAEAESITPVPSKAKILHPSMMKGALAKPQIEVNSDKAANKAEKPANANTIKVVPVTK